MQKNKKAVHPGITKAVAEAAHTLTAMPMQPKYRLGELLRAKYGELGTEQGVNALTLFCGLKSRRTVREWLTIPAGADTEIMHIVLALVLQFFDLASPDELLTPSHKSLLKTA